MSPKALLVFVLSLVLVGVAVAQTTPPPDPCETQLRTIERAMNGYVFENAQLRLKVAQLEGQLATRTPPPAPEKK